MYYRNSKILRVCKIFTKRIAKKDIYDYYNVPTVLSQKKEYAEVFKAYFESKIGKCDLVFTKNAEGRKILLKARMKSIDIKDVFERREEYSNFR